MTTHMRAEQTLEQVTALQQWLSERQKEWRKTKPKLNRLGRNTAHKNRPEYAPLRDFITEHDANLKILSTELGGLVNRLTDDHNHLALVANTLQDGIRKARMLPLTKLFEAFPRMVRDLARERNKEVDLWMEGGEIEVDRQVLELLKDPLLHLLRNALDHGIETPEQRTASGKPRNGGIHLCAEQRGSNLVLEITDDGAGIDIEKIRQKAVENNLYTATEAAGFKEPELLNLIFRSGFTTSGYVTEISGRGVGMDIVRQNVEQLHGLIHVRTNLGQGTTITMTLPLLLTTSHVLLVRSGGEIVALPLMNVERILEIAVSKIKSVDGRPAIFVEGQHLHLMSLAQLLQLPAANKPFLANAKAPVVVLSVVDQHIALYVDGFLSTQEVVVKKLGRQLRRVRNVAGVTILGDGQLVIVINVADLSKSIQTAPAAPAAFPVLQQEIRQSSVLIVDDSITTRMLEKHILENAGYLVTTAADGQEAWDFIRSQAAGLDLIISDINMPQMDGYTLTETIKSNPATANIPVILITSMESPQEKIRGMEAGADAYIVKSSFDQRDLLNSIDRLIG